MKKIALYLSALLATLALQSYAAPVYAQQTSGVFRSWISGTGDDHNTVDQCQPTTPCKSFSAALSITGDGGEVNCSGPGEPGTAGEPTITITGRVTIDCHGTFGGMLFVGRDGIVINAPGATVTLRGLSLDGFFGNLAGETPGLNGVVIMAAAVVNIEDCVIENFSQSGISVTTAANTILIVRNTTIRGVANGISFAPTGGAVNGSIDHTMIAKMSGDGITGTGRAYFTVTNSVISNAATVGINAGSGTVFEVDSSSVINNNVAFGTSNGSIRISRDNIYDNNKNYSISGGTIFTSGDNYVAVNGSTVPNGNITRQ